ncbi:transcription antiterminator [Paenibacillus sp. N1-5-1-14]|uniref:BglG family transcription antiterminator n=1 Tax=Paenibacillus radicibacter TaxID=2972488 RepID=UPI00215961F4|nr:transcription antiterminator [Paenibacillus radicibacter]MCR8644728.1 transcription antiterminator [Paenibacillus radicibacter]
MNDSSAYTIQRVISNNVVQVQGDQPGTEIILTGKGLGFGVKAGAELASDDPRIEKKYMLDDQQETDRYQSMFDQIDREVLDVSQDIISMISKEFDTDLNDQVFFALPSHIQFALHRLKSEMEIVNPFIFEIQTLHHKEYEIAQKAADMIAQAFSIDVPEPEVGFLAMHIQSAVCHVSLGNIVKDTHLIQELVSAIEEAKDIHIPRDSIDYVRLITHLRFAIERLKTGKVSKNPFVNQLKESLPEEYVLAKKVSAILGERLELPVPEDEIGYIVMHLYRLFQQYDPKSQS